MNIFARRLLMVALLLSLTVLVLSACGGGDSGSSADPPQITRAELIKKGDAICARADREQRVQLTTYVKDHPNAQKSEASYVQMIGLAGLPPVASEIEQLKALGMPKADEASVTAIVAGFEKALKSAEADPKLVMTTTGGPFAAPDKLAAQYGFKACAEPL